MAFALLGALAPSSLSYADNPAYSFSPPQGYVSGLPGSQWSFNATADTATAGMPGNLPGQVTAKLSSASYAKLVAAADTGVTAPSSRGGVQIPLSVKADASTSPLDPAISGCLGSNMTPGYVNQCVAYSTTLTFPRPVWNPVITHMTSLGYGWRVVGSGANTAYRCWLTWNEAQISSVNGAAPAAGQVSLLTTNGAANVTPDPLTQTFAGDRVAWRGFPVVSNTAIPTGTEGLDQPCAPTVYNVSAAFQLTGLVTSVTLSTPVVATITRSSGSFSSLQNPVVEVSPSRYLGFGVPSADLSIVKSGPATASAGGSISWTVTVTNSPGSAGSRGFIIRDAVPAGVTDVRLVDPPAGCSMSGNNVVCSQAPPGYALSGNAAANTVADVSGAATSASVPPVLAPGASFTIAIAGTVAASQTGPVSNTATVSGVDADPDTSNNASTANTDVAAALSVPIQKNGYGPAGQVVGVGGAAFRILSDDSGRPGAAFAAASVKATDDAVGRFQATGLVPGTYWLEETRAPAGYALLAAPVAFAVGADGAIAVLNPATNPNVTVERRVLTVLDQPSFVLPRTGGAGGGPFLAAGGAAVLIGLVCWRVLRRHRGFVQV